MIGKPHRLVRIAWVLLFLFLGMDALRTLPSPCLI